MLGPLPNVHAALVHFPIALLTVGVLADLLALARPSASQLRRFASVVLATGTVLMVPTYLSGRQAGDAAESPFPEMERVLGEHADWATATLWFFLALVAMRLVAEWKGRLRGPLHLSFAVLGVAGGYLVFQTGEHGGELVFGMGVGVRPLQEVPKEVFQTGGVAADGDLSLVGPLLTQDGGLRWELARQSAEQFSDHFLSDEPGEIRIQWNAEDSALVLRSPGPRDRFALHAGVLGDVSLEAEFGIPSQGGSVGLVHHWIDAENFDALVVDASEMRLVRVRSGKERVLDRSARVEADTWHSYRVVGSGGHFRGYLDDALVVHGHASPGAIGRVGFQLPANSAFALRRVVIAPIGKEE